MPLIQENSLLPISGIPIIEIEAIITMYNPIWWQTDSTPEIVASGKEVKEGMIACPIWLKFGTLVEIDNKVYVCEDRMNSRYQNENRFDILVFDLQEAKDFGLQKKIIKIYQ